MAGWEMSAAAVATAWKGYLVAIAVSGLVAATAASVVQGWRYRAEIAEIRAAHDRGQAEVAHASLDAARTDIATIAEAAKRAALVAPTLTARVNLLSKALTDATPLPAGCRPDAVRVRSLTDAVRATNSAATGQEPR